MRTVHLRIACLALCYALAQSAGAGRVETSIPAEHRPNLVLTSSSSAASFKSTPGDTFFLYGGPGSLLGKFQTALPNGNPDWQGWTAYDPTDQPPLWQLSSFHSPTGTQAMWAGRDASQEPGWDTAPGYGNGWDAWLVYRKPVTIPSAGQTVELSFVLHHDVEPGYDFFYVEYDAGEVTHIVLTRTGSTGSLPLLVDGDTTLEQPIVYAGNDYGPNDEIVLRLRVSSDVIWSDEDGGYDGDGAAQVDNITVTSSEGVDFEDFEGSTPYLWQPSKSPFAGLFAQIFPRVTDLDPCRENETPVLGFIDDGTPPSNPGGVLWTGEPIPSLGTTSPTWIYGIPGGWVVNYNGGLSAGMLPLLNEVWSPELDWDQPGGDDDGGDVAGAFLRFDVYQHLPLNNGIFFTWHVRGHANGSGIWDDWRARGFVYYSSATEWRNRQVDVSDILPIDRDRVQVKLGVHDLAVNFGFPGSDATVAPLFDNVSFAKYRVGGPVIAVHERDLFGDSFASSGLADVSTQAARDLLDCRVDMSRSISAGNAPIRSGDSIVVDVTSIIPGAAISDPMTQISLHYSLNKNPLFEDAIRPNAPDTQVGTGLFFGWDQSEAAVHATQSTTTAGVAVENRFFFDLPDDGFFYPGDVLEYYIQAVDDAGRSSTLPADLSGYDDGRDGLRYDPAFRIRALPSYSDASGRHPEVLVWNDFANRDGDLVLEAALASICLDEGVDHDTYRTAAAASGIDNGLGSASPNGRGHGATLAQISGYRAILYDSGDLSSVLISDGSDNSVNDKGNDVGLVRSWFDEPNEHRQIAHFGDNIAWFLGGNGWQGGSASPPQLSYMANVMGVTISATDVRPTIGQQTAPHVLPSGLVPAFTSDFVAFGGCLAINLFDNIGPTALAVRSHGFEVSGSPGSTYSYPGRAAGVVWDRWVGNRRKLSVTFPYGMVYVQDYDSLGPQGLGLLLADIFRLLFVSVHLCPVAVDETQQRKLEVLAASPNPFNPRTTLQFVLGREAKGDIEIFDVRGRSVRALARNADFPAGENQLVWNGRDEGGAEIASGVYLVRYRIDGFTKQQKLVLVR